MYQYGTANDYQNNQDSTFLYLNRKFAGRGLAHQARTSADSYGSEVMYGYRGASSAPLTLGEFERNYRQRSGYAHVTKITAPQAVNKNIRPEAAVKKSVRTTAERPVSVERHSQTRSAVSTSAKSTVSNPAQANNNRTRSVQQNKVTAARYPTGISARRAVKNEKSGKIDEFMGKFRSGIGSLPMGAMLTVLVCAVSLMFIVGSSVLLSDASDDYVEMQNEISALAKQEDELLIALEVKNDLRTIESIAVGKLGMVKKDLVTRQYIKLSDEDIIECYEEDNKNVGLSTLLTAIGGN